MYALVTQELALDRFQITRMIREYTHNFHRIVQIDAYENKIESSFFENT